MRFDKKKLIPLTVFLILALGAVLFSGDSRVYAKLSRDIFPETLNGLPMTLFEEETPDEELKEGFSVDYEDEETTITIFFWLLKDKTTAQETVRDLIEATKIEFDYLFDRIDWGTESQVSVKSHTAKTINYRAYLWGEYIDGGFMFLSVDEYFISVQIINNEGKPSTSELKEIISMFVDKVPEQEPPPAPPEPPPSEPSPEPPSPPAPEQPVCENNNCEYWLNENCKDCPQDCAVEDFCCAPNNFFMYPSDYHNKIYNLHEDYGGAIPNRAFIVEKGIPQSNFFSDYSPRICDKGNIVAGECIESWNCTDGVCKDFKCVKTVSQEVQKVEDKKVVEEIYKEQTDYKIGYAQTYTQIKDDITFSIQEPGLDIKLEVQGNTAGKIPKVNKGDEVTVRLEIENISDHTIALTAGIIYPGADFGSFQLTEKEYTMSFGWWWKGVLNWSSLIGSFKTKLVGGRYIVMPKNSKLLIYSKIVPEQTGYLDVQGIVYFTSEKRFVEPTPEMKKYVMFPNEDVFIWETGETQREPQEYETTFDETEVSESILVEEKKCGWNFCLW